jgi:phosphohistidine phosphatase
MKTVIIVRHAKAVGKDIGIPDIERSLTRKGVADSQIMAARLKELGRTADLFMSSPANRAVETAHAFADVLDYPVQKILVKDILYDGPAEPFLEIVRNLDEAYQSVLMFGHNPDFAEFAHLLSAQFTHDLPKAAVLIVEFGIDRWHQLTAGAGAVAHFDYPARKATQDVE